jgi:hypothetical protein
MARPSHPSRLDYSNPANVTGRQIKDERGRKIK